VNNKVIITIMTNAIDVRVKTEINTFFCSEKFGYSSLEMNYLIVIVKEVSAFRDLLLR